MSVQEIENQITQLRPDEFEVLMAWMQRHQPNSTDQPRASVQPVFTAENDPFLARIEAQIAEAPTDPDAIREAEEDLLEFMRNMNANRRAVGVRLPYPEVD